METSEKTTFDDKFKISLFFSTAGIELRTLASGLTYENTFESLITAIRTYLRPITNLVVERHTFFTLTQDPTETFQSYLVRLRKQVKRCDFSDTSVDTPDSQLIRDQFIRGISNNTIRETLLKESNLTLAKTEQIANCAIAAQSNCKLFATTPHTEPVLHVNSTSPKSSFTCYTCGKPGHFSKDCRKTKRSQHYSSSLKSKCTTCNTAGHLSKDCYKNHKCSLCSKIGHTETYCRSLKAKTHSVKSSNNCILSVSQDSSTLLFEKVSFYNSEANLVIDTGSSISLLSKDYISQNFLNSCCTPCTKECRVANGETLTLTSCIKGKLTVGSKTVEAKFFVADNFEFDGLLGVDLLRQIGLSIGSDAGIVLNIRPSIVDEFSDIFDKPLNKCILQNVAPFTMISVDSETSPKMCNVRKLSKEQESVIAQKVSDLLKDGVIRESTSPWRHQPFCIPKDGNGWRMVINYKPINAVTLSDGYPIPPMQSIFDSIGEAKFFTNLDFSQFYHQLPLIESNIPKTAFYANNKLYEYLRCPFGLKNAVAYCYRILNKVLEGCKGVSIYLDDVLIHGKTKAEHDDNLRAVFERIRAHGLGLNLKKCSFAKTEIKYLGFILSQGTRRPDPDRIKKLLDFPLPVSAVSLQRFIGMCGFFQNFIYNFSELIKPLYMKLRCFSDWTDDEKSLFNELKSKISSALLTIPAETEELFLYTDASDNCIAGILVNKNNQPVQFCSRMLNSAEKKYDIVEKEALAIYWSVQRCRNFLLGRTFTVFCDHKPLQFLFRNETPSSKVLRWRLSLNEFNFHVQYLPGKQNEAADCFSRAFLIDDLPDAITFDEVKSKQLHCKETQSMIEALNKRFTMKPSVVTPKLWSIRKQFEVKNSVLYSDNRLFVPYCLRLKVMTLAHDSHWGQEATYNHLRYNYFWPSMRNEVYSFVKNCRICSLTKPHFHNPPLQPMITKSPFECLACDFVGPLPEFNGFKYLLVVIDYYSRYPFVFPTRNMDTSTVTEKFLEIFSQYGYPDSILSDRGTNFESEMFHNFCRSRNIKKKRTTAYHPQGNGLCERFNKTLKQQIFNLLTHKGLERRQWPKVLKEALYSYRFSVHSTTGFRPVDLFMGFQCRGRLSFSPNTNTKNELVVFFCQI